MLFFEFCIGCSYHFYMVSELYSSDLCILPLILGFKALLCVFLVFFLFFSGSDFVFLSSDLEVRVCPTGFGVVG
ncbi:hypothetical protein HanIR_Chr09g0404441 [Helianthus annuus]|nr:hypothetical protein HanHA89_Chr16g0652271 [Helianthus annuus]KAJ0485953.1 hypothetical protein HanHA89_Chr14g0574191 [Helianthus annuus]KAJ0533096.1 hypothetical protein HanIR_Chr09g0404441 [Helianthus annuus]KAJ0656508.1 hypothetical protein HanLR1_Chr14g0536601 [Helianthus annuus]